MTRYSLRAALAALALLSGTATASLAAELEGVTLADEVTVDGTKLVLNGIGRRVYSIFNVTVYVGGLYLERITQGAAAILDSDQKKLFEMELNYQISRSDMIDAWKDSFKDNCAPNCAAVGQALEKFYGLVPAVVPRDRMTYLLESGRVSVSKNGQKLGEIDDPLFPRLLLSTVIGPVPPTEELKRALTRTGS